MILNKDVGLFKSVRPLQLLLTPDLNPILPPNSHIVLPVTFAQADRVALVTRLLARVSEATRQTLLILLLALQDVHLVVHAEQDAESRQVSERRKGPIGLLLSNALICIEIHTNDVAADAGPTVAHQNRTDSHLEKAIFGEGLSKIEDNVRPVLLSGAEKVLEAVWVPLLHALPQLVDGALVDDVQSRFCAKSLAKVIASIKHKCPGIASSKSRVRGANREDFLVNGGRKPLIDCVVELEARVALQTLYKRANRFGLHFEVNGQAQWQVFC